MSFITATQHQQMVNAAAHEQAKKETVAYVYRKHPTVIQCNSSAKMIIELIARWLGDSDVNPTPALWDTMIEQHGGEALSMLATQSVEKTHSQLVEEILSLLASKNNGRDGKFDAYNLRSEQVRMKSWSIDALRQRLYDIKTKQRMASAPVSALKSFVAEQRRDTSPYPGYPQMPKEVWQDGKNVPLNRANIVKLDAYEVKRLSRIYGQQQLNDRLAQ